MEAAEILAARDRQYRETLRQIGNAIGFGNAQSILGDLWDEMLFINYGAGGRGAMGVTVDDALPPIPRPAHRRRQQRGNGAYCMVPAYTVAELKQFGHAAIAKALGTAPEAQGGGDA